MAFLLKDQHRVQGTTGKQAVVDQWIRVSVPAVALPASTTGQVFRVKGGRVLVKLLLAEVTTVIQSQATTFKFSSKALDSASAAIGTAVDLTATVDLNAKEVGALHVVEGDGSAGILSNAGAAYIGSQGGTFILPQGEVYATTVATSTGKLKYDLWYQPLDPGAYVEPVAFTAAGILPVAI
jgi:hypothetical protein